MPRRQPDTPGPVPSRKPSDPTANLRQALGKRKKAELVDALVELAQADHGVLRQLNARFDVSCAPHELVADTLQAITDATKFDERRMNTNFDYDYQAYSDVKRNLGRLIEAGHLRQAMPLALELMKRGSTQVEMSDEGMMTDDIEDCLNVILKALKTSDIPPAEGSAWCSAMLENDRVKFIAREGLERLRAHFLKAAVR